MRAFNRIVLLLWITVCTYMVILLWVRKVNSTHHYRINPETADTIKNWLFCVYSTRDCGEPTCLTCEHVYGIRILGHTWEIGMKEAA